MKRNEYMTGRYWKPRVVEGDPFDVICTIKRGMLVASIQSGFADEYEWQVRERYVTPTGSGSRQLAEGFSDTLEMAKNACMGVMNEKG